MNALRKWFDSYITGKSISSAERLRRALEKDGWIVGLYNADTLNFNKNELNEQKVSLHELHKR